MKRIRVYIADMDEGFVGGIRRCARRHGAIEIAGHSANGSRALEDIIRLTPDVLVTDVALPGLDGIALLREIRRLKSPPAALVCTGFYSAECMACAKRYAASFFLCKPVDPDSLCELILECGEARRVAPAPDADADAAERSRAALTASMLKRLGMPARLAGSVYIIEAVARHSGDALAIKNLSKGLYAQLAGRMDTTVPRIERSLRNAIAVAYERGELHRHFTHRPSNKEFIEFMMRSVDDEI